MKNLGIIGIFLFVLIPFIGNHLKAQASKARVIVMTDGEIDDHSSMIRFLLYSCEVEVCAIIETNSIFQREGHSKEDWYEKQLAAYERVYPNLIKHHPGYPTADYLRIEHHVKNNHGPLGALYPQAYVSEGDSPAFFYSLSNGLRNYEDPTFGGWGGRFEKTDEFDHVYKDAVDQGDNKQSLRMWIEDVNRDFQARMDWCVADRFEEANHQPLVALENDFSKQVKYVEASPGDLLSFSAANSYDPDGDELEYQWWIYPEAGTYQGSVSLLDAQKSRVRLSIPDEINGQSIHLILTVRDKDEPYLTRYRRVVIYGKK